MPVPLGKLQQGDVYIDYMFEDAKFRYEKQTEKVYRRFYGETEVEIRPDSDIYNQAILSGREITRDEYYADEYGEEWFWEHARRLDAERARELADAKAAAAASGKEPFDLARLETMCDTSREGRLDPVESRQARFEDMYYVQYSRLRTLAELAQVIEELNRWS